MSKDDEMRQFCTDFCDSYGLKVGEQTFLTSCLILQRWYTGENFYTLFRLGSNDELCRVAEISPAASLGFVHVAYGIFKSIESGDFAP